VAERENKGHVTELERSVHHTQRCRDHSAIGPLGSEAEGPANRRAHGLQDTVGPATREWRPYAAALQQVRSQRRRGLGALVAQLEVDGDGLARVDATCAVRFGDEESHGWNND